jgi:hypothetical protein
VIVTCSPGLIPIRETNAAGGEVDGSPDAARSIADWSETMQTSTHPALLAGLNSTPMCAAFHWATASLTADPHADASW